MHLEQEFHVDRPPETVFDYLTNPANLADWQTSKTSVQQLTPGPPGLGTRVRERTRGPGGRTFEQVVEFTEFDRPRRVHVHVVEGPYPVDATWSFTPAGGGTDVRFVSEGALPGLLRLLEPLAKHMLGRRMTEFHGNLLRNVQALPIQPPAAS